MISPELIQKINKLFIRSRKQTTELFSGEYETAFRGRGMAFEEYREYVPGDDIRFIDWKVTARTGKAHVKVFREEREQVIFLMIDGSRSNLFGSGKKLKSEIISEIGGVLAYAASRSNDNVGLLIFTDKIEVYLPPKKGRAHVWSIISKIMTFQPKDGQTDISMAINWLSRIFTRRSACFLISDFIDQNFHRHIPVFAFKHDLVCLHVTDPVENEWLVQGAFWVKDLETGVKSLVDLSSQRKLEAYKLRQHARQKQIESVIRKSQSDYLHINTSSDYIRSLINLFQMRDRRQVRRA